MHLPFGSKKENLAVKRPKTKQTSDTLAAIGICLRGVESRGAAQAHRTFATPSRTNANCSASHRTKSHRTPCQHYVCAKMAVLVCIS